MPFTVRKMLASNRHTTGNVIQTTKSANLFSHLRQESGLSPEIWTILIFYTLSYQLVNRHCWQMESANRSRHWTRFFLFIY